MVSDHEILPKQNSIESQNNPVYSKQSPSKSPIHENEAVTHGPASPTEVSDNREMAVQTEPLKEQKQPTLPVETILQMAAELKEIRTRVDKLDKIELSISTLTNQIGGLVEHTSKLEHSVDANSTKLNEVTEEVSSLQKTVELQGEAIAKLTTIKTEIKKCNKAALGEMKDLLDKQQEQMET